MGIDKSKAYTRACVYLPNMYSDIKQVAKQCAIYNKYAKTNQKEPLLSYPIPVYPWETLTSLPLMANILFLS